MIFLLFNILIYLRHPKIVLRFRKRVGHFPNVALPQRFPDRMLWRKLFDRNPLFGVFCDKLKTKEYAAARVPGIQIPAVLWQGDQLNSQAIKILQDGGVLKANHGCLMNVFSSQNLKAPELHRITSQWMKKTYGRRKLEWGYRLAEKKLFIEALLVPANGQLIDLSVRASNGQCLLVSCIINNKTENQKLGYFSVRGERLHDLDASTKAESVLASSFELPACYQDCINYASKLSVDIDYARYDFIVSDHQAYMGEITVYPGSGWYAHRTAMDRKFNSILSNGWSLAKSHFFERKAKGFLGLYQQKLASRLNV